MRVLLAHELGSCSSDLELAELTVSCEVEDDGYKLNASGFGFAEINADSLEIDAQTSSRTSPSILKVSGSCEAFLKR